jgi:predicted nuclease of predicted toxin-antitoxin system
MRLYLDQMFRAALVGMLRDAGHDVIRAADVGQARADDEAILSRVCHEGRILVTLDEHFGDWTILPLSKHPGVIRVKIHPSTTRNAAALLLPFLAGRRHEDFVDSLVIVSKRRIRWIKTG